MVVRAHDGGAVVQVLFAQRAPDRPLHFAAVGAGFLELGIVARDVTLLEHGVTRRRGRRQLQRDGVGALARLVFDVRLHGPHLHLGVGLQRELEHAPLVVHGRERHGDDREGQQVKVAFAHETGIPVHIFWPASDRCGRASRQFT